jgi:hypothetical protein
MKKEYHKHIISTSEHQVWLHRTSKNLVDHILEKGLGIGTDLSSTATIQPQKLEHAEGLYKSGKDFGGAAIVIKIPQEIAKRHYLQAQGLRGPGHEGYLGDKEVTYYNNSQFNIQRQHIHGWIDRETDEYHENPYLGEPQKLTDKHFPKSFYGGLEKDLVEVKTHRIKTKKQRRLKKGELPTPPAEIQIID